MHLNYKCLESRAWVETQYSVMKLNLAGHTYNLCPFNPCKPQGKIIMNWIPLCNSCHTSEKQNKKIHIRLCIQHSSQRNSTCWGKAFNTNSKSNLAKPKLKLLFWNSNSKNPSFSLTLTILRLKSWTFNYKNENMITVCIKKNDCFRNQKIKLDASLIYKSSLK